MTRILKKIEQMRILILPLEANNLDSNEAIPNRIHLLSSENQIFGVKRKGSFARGLPDITSFIKFVVYIIRVFCFGIIQRKELDLIYCFEWFYSLVGLLIGIFIGKPCIRDCASVTNEWLKRVKPSLFVMICISISEKIIKRYARLNVLLSEADRKAYIANGYDPDRLVVIPRPADLSLADRVVQDRQSLRKKLGFEPGTKYLLYSGKRDYPPNMEAAEWIIKVLAPALAQRTDSIRILMTGSGKQPVATHPIVTLTGFVPDLFEYIHASDVFIAPIEMPSGRLTKAFDSLSCATPTVVLESATNGIPELVDGDNAMIARDRNEFIEKTIYLLEHPDEAREIGLRGRKMLEEHYDWNFWEEKLNRALQSCLANTERK